MVTRESIKKSVYAYGARAVYLAASATAWRRDLRALGLDCRTLGDRDRASLEAWIVLRECKLRA